MRSSQFSSFPREKTISRSSFFFYEKIRKKGSRFKGRKQFCPLMYIYCVGRYFIGNLIFLTEPKRGAVSLFLCVFIFVERNIICRISTYGAPKSPVKKRGDDMRSAVGLMQMRHLRPKTISLSRQEGDVGTISSSNRPDKTGLDLALLA